MTMENHTGSPTFRIDPMNQIPLPTTHYSDQLKNWPEAGRHILAHYDDETIVVYQAYRPTIGHFAIEHGYFGSEFKYSRMSWIKPNFLWMMYRSSWGQAEGQEVVLGIRLRRTFFDSLLEQAVPSTFSPALFDNRDLWKAAVSESDVRLQWDPDHQPDGTKCERRAVQLGLRGKVLESFGKREIVEIIDMSEFVNEQKNYISISTEGALLTPTESVYLPTSNKAISQVGLDQWCGESTTHLKDEK